MGGLKPMSTCIDYESLWPPLPPTLLGVAEAGSVPLHGAESIWRPPGVKGHRQSFSCIVEIFILEGTEKLPSLFRRTLPKYTPTALFYL